MKTDKGELRTPVVLVIEDNPYDQKLYKQILESEDFHVELASSRQHAYASIGRQRPDLILLDVTLPDISGFDLCRELTSSCTTESIPIVFLSALNEDIDILRGFEVGGSDFISKPVRQELLLARVRTHVHIGRLQQSLYQFNKNLEQLVQQRTRELRISEERLDYALQSLSGGIWDWDIGTGRVYFSPKCLDSLGYLSSEKPKSMSEWDQYLHPDDKKGTVEIRQKYIQGAADSLDVVYRIMAKDGSYYWHHDRGLIAERDPYGHPLRVVGNSQDITETIKKELLNKKLEKHVTNARKMESLGTLAGGLAHEFNNILAVAFGLLDLERLSNRQANSDESANLHKMGLLLNRAKDLVQQISTFSTHDRSEKRPLNLIEACTEIVSYLEDTAPDNITLKLIVDEQDVVVLLNRTQLHQIVSNLFNNSVYAMQEQGGYITLSVEPIVIAENQIPLSVSLKPGHYACLTFVDTGVGMGEEQLGRLFEPFYTTKKEDSGTGMGLAIVHGIVHSHGGHIDVSSKEGESTCFRMYFPLCAGGGARKAHSQALSQASGEPGQYRESIPDSTVMSPASSSKKIDEIKVLFVDDEPEISGIISTLLSQYGMTVRIFDSPMEALEEFTCHSQLYSIVVTDQSMPNMTGLELAEKIKYCNSAVPILILTGLNDFQQNLSDTEQTMEVCTKPINIEDLVKRIRRLCSSS